MKHRLAALYDSAQIGGVLLPEEYLSKDRKTPGIQWVLAALTNTSARYSSPGYPLLVRPALTSCFSVVSTSHYALSIIFFPSQATASYLHAMYLADPTGVRVL